MAAAAAALAASSELDVGGGGGGKIKRVQGAVRLEVRRSSESRLPSHPPPTQTSSAPCSGPRQECGLIRVQCLLKETSSALCNAPEPLLKQEREDHADPTSFGSHQFYAPLEPA